MKLLKQLDKANWNNVKRIVRVGKLQDHEIQISTIDVQALLSFSLRSNHPSFSFKISLASPYFCIRPPKKKKNNNIKKKNFRAAFVLEQFYLHPIHFFLHPIKEMGCKHGVCVIWGI